eukprot:TRINITY_DN5080_c0_g3_i3.p3 TRINITY_DN5080_c0_g3~~TRINITY_DN5080_c0_g3_i3.p3  ORF type:complete len:144 (+),score=10.87 TRINITY_DN5080_c0_g3_i3:447-878(+)
MVLIADCQKYFILQTRQQLISKKEFDQQKKGKFLITSGIFSYSRNPNYLGEILIYSSFAILSENQLVWKLFSLIWLTLFWGRMIVKENSLRQKDGWNEYAKRSSFLLFKICENSWINALIWIFIIGYLVFDYQIGGSIKLLKI